MFLTLLPIWLPNSILRAGAFIWCLSVSHTVAFLAWLSWALLPYHYPTYWTCVMLLWLMCGSFGGIFKWAGRGSTFTLKIPLPLQVGTGTPSCSQLYFLCHWKNNWLEDDHDKCPSCFGDHPEFIEPKLTVFGLRAIFHQHLSSSFNLPLLFHMFFSVNIFMLVNNNFHNHFVFLDWCEVFIYI